MMPSIPRAASSASSASASVTADVFGAADYRLSQAMFRADTGIIETGGNRMRLANLPHLVLQQVGAIAMQHADACRR